MKLSRYVKIYPCRHDPQKMLIFSTRTLAKILVPTSTLQAITEERLTAQERETLVRNGFLVSDTEAERRHMLTVIADSEERMGKSYLMAVMNLDCNLACRYCYEGKERGKHYMSRDTANLLVEYSDVNFLQRGKDICIDFYGGEPLLSLDLIKEISRQLGVSAKKAGREYTFSLVTNGTLLTKDVVAKLRDHGLKRVRVTLDGPRDNHNYYRPLVSGKGSFDLIVKNLAEISDLVKIGIGGNYSRENYREFSLLLQQLAESGLTPDKISHVIFGPIAGTLGEHLIPEFSGGCTSTDEPWLIDATLFLREEILRRGYFTPRVSPTTCMVEYRNQLVVHYDGSFYKCPAFIGRKGMEVGNLVSGVRPYEDTYNLDLWRNDDCLDCAYLPLCFGGCRFLKLLRDGAMDGVQCRKEYFDASLEELVLQDIRFPRKRGGWKESESV